MNAKKVSPARYKFEDTGCEWVNLVELAEILGIPALNCLKKYFHLSTAAMKVSGPLHAHFTDRELGLYTFGELIRADAITIFLPVDWAIDVLKQLFPSHSAAVDKTSNIADNGVICDRCHCRVLLIDSKCPVCGFCNSCD